MNEANTLYVTLDGPVDEQNVAQMLQQLDPVLSTSSGIEYLYLVINTPGGGVNAGITLYNYLRGLPVKVITHNIGQVDSIGNVIFLAGDERYAAPATSFLFHGVAFGGNGSFSFSLAHLEERLSQVKQDEKRIETIVKDRTELGPRKLASFFRSGRSISPDEALGFKIIDEVRLLSIPDNAQRAVINTFPIQNIPGPGI